MCIQVEEVLTLHVLGALAMQPKCISETLGQRPAQTSRHCQAGRIGSALPPEQAYLPVTSSPHVQVADVSGIVIGPC